MPPPTLSQRMAAAGQKQITAMGLRTRIPGAAGAAYRTIAKGYQAWGDAGGGGGGGGGRRTARTVTQVAPQKPSKDIMGLFTEAMKRYQPGGGFGRREEALLARAKKKYLASSAQRMVSAGLSGTTVPMAEETKFEEERGDPFRAGLEETRTSRLNELLMAKAGYMGGLGAGSTTVQTQYGDRDASDRGGGRSLIGRVEPHAPQRPIFPQRPAPTAPMVPPSGTEAGFRQIPEGGRIVGDYYFPPTRFTRNRPEDVVPQEF